MPDLLPTDLRPGDVLLYQGNSWVSRVIRKLDGGDYSHAAIYDGRQIMEALGDGITVDQVSQSIAGANFVDVFRFIGSSGKMLGDPLYPLAPLAERISYYEQNRQRYAYEQILLLAILVSTRRASAGLLPGLSLLLRDALDSAADVLARIIAAGQQPVICSELVYRCYDEADPGGKYKLLIRGADVLGGAEMAAAFAEAQGEAAVMPVDPLAAEKQAFLARWAQAKGVATVPSPLLSAAQTFTAVADFVTPHDLQVSPNLLRVGRLASAVGAARATLVMAAESTVAGVRPAAFMRALSIPPGPTPSPGRPLVAVEEQRRPEYFPRLLLVRASRSQQSARMFSELAAAAGSAPAAAAAATSAQATVPMSDFLASIQAFGIRGVGLSPGVTALAQFEQAGKVRKATPLSRRRPAEPSHSMGFAVAAVAAGSADVESSIPAGTLIEMADDSDVQPLIDALKADNNFEVAERVPIRYLVTSAAPGAAIPLAAPPTGPLWNLQRIQWTQAQAVFNFASCSRIKVAVLDTGIDANHPDLSGRISSYIYDNVSDPTLSSDRDIVGHGTHVTGTIGARFGSPVGISGIAPCELHCWKIFTDQPMFISPIDGFVYVVDPGMYIRALTDCVDQRVDVMNLSIGGTAPPSQQEKDLFNALIGQGTIICAAMGNARQQGSPREYPGAIDGVIAVGATSIDDTFAYFSSRGDHIALCAPGMGIWSTLPTYPGNFGFAAVQDPTGKWVRGPAKVRETDYDAWQGTSMATPHVTAAAALLRAKIPGIQPHQAKAALMASADKVPDMQGQSFTPDYGAGRLNLFTLLR